VERRPGAGALAEAAAGFVGDVHAPAVAPATWPASPGAVGAAGSAAGVWCGCITGGMGAVGVRPGEVGGVGPLCGAKV